MTITYLPRQLADINSIFESIVGDFMGDERVARSAPGQNMIGTTIWRMPRTQDAHVQTWIRGESEVLYVARWSDWQPLRRLGYGIGISLKEAD